MEKIPTSEQSLRWVVFIFYDTFVENLKFYSKIKPAASAKDANCEKIKKVRTTKFDKKIFQMNAKLFSQNLTIVNQSRYFFMQLSYLQNRNGISGPIEIIVYT